MSKRKNDKQDNNDVLLTIIGIITLLVAVIGATFAYFTATVNNNNRESVIVTTQSPVALVYTGAELKLENALPGNSSQNTFTVYNPDTSPSNQSYDLVFYIDSNNFETSTGDNLTIKITAESNGTYTPTIIGDFASAAEKDYTDGGTYNNSYSNKFVEDQVIEPDETHTYTTKVEFHEKNVEDNRNITKTFTSHIDIEDAKNITTP